MIEQITNFFTIKMIYLWLNTAVLPFWISLIFFPSSSICKYLVKSIFPFFLLSLIYIYLIYFYFLADYNFLNNFNLYLGLADLKSLFSDDGFLIMFWSHFLAINLFCGGWMVNDYQKFNMPKALIFFPLIITYFVGPLGIFIYWIFKIFYAKKINLYD